MDEIVLLFVPRIAKHADTQTDIVAVLLVIQVTDVLRVNAMSVVTPLLLTNDTHTSDTRTITPDTLTITHDTRPITHDTRTIHNLPSFFYGF